MDVSVLCAIGSFWVSESVLKPKATVLAILGCVLAYDLTFKTHDVASLRAYRGPAMLAFVLMMAALSLRTWRRNGIACDELLFLPGTPHDERLQIQGPLVGVGGRSVSGGSAHSPHAAAAAISSSSILAASSPPIPVIPPTSLLEMEDRRRGRQRRRHRHSWHHQSSAPSRLQQQQKQKQQLRKQKQSLQADESPDEGDIAGGGAVAGAASGGNTGDPETDSRDPLLARARSSAVEEENGNHSQGERDVAGQGPAAATGQAPAASTTNHRSQGTLAESRASSISSINEFANSWEEDMQTSTTEEVAATAAAVASNNRDSLVENAEDDDDDDDPEHDIEAGERVPLNVGTSNNSVVSNNMSALSTASQQRGGGGGGLDEDADETEFADDEAENDDDGAQRRGRSFSGTMARAGQSVMNRFRDPSSRHQVTHIGSVFFFRSSTSNTVNAEYAPSGPSVVGAALDMSIPIILNFHLFVEAFNHISEHGGSDLEAKILPLIFLTILLFRVGIPPGRRGRFFNTIKYTLMAPFHRSRFRDSFIGDVLTSLVRPLQDIVFALAYYITVVWGTISFTYGLSESGQKLECSPLLHNVVLPSCALLPLWWKFLQTLRESYDTGKRWPHLGNAFKYLSAAMVILYGMTHPEDRRSPWWIVSFILTLLYQIWWDTVMDWELFVVVPRSDVEAFEDPRCFEWVSSLPANSYLLLTVERYLCQPVRDWLRFSNSCIPSWRQIRLRPQRLYRTESFYWMIFFYNCATRFMWMLSFIPAYHLSSSGSEHVTTFSSDTKTYVGVVLPVMEMLRRTFWGFLLLEVETIRMTSAGPSNASTNPNLMSDDSEHWDSADNSKIGRQYLHRLANWLDVETRRKLFITELTLWVVAFCVLGLLATT